MIKSIERLKNILTFVKKALQFLANPKLLFCLGMAWFITNGWSYLFVGLGTYLNIRWMSIVGSAYIGFLWILFTPEKIITILLAIFLLKKLFPKDEKTLKVFTDEYKKLKNKFKRTSKKQGPTQ